MVQLERKRLTPRQVEVMCRYAGGSSRQAIADDLTISYRTVGSHLRDIKLRLGVGSLREALLCFAKSGMDGDAV